MSLKIVVFALVVATAADDVIEQQEDQDEIFHNEWDELLNFTCPEFEVIKNVYSIHDNDKEDRRWRFECGRTPEHNPNTCVWTEDYVNDWDQPILFMCPANYMITGIESVHDNSREDRRMKVRCCRRHGWMTRACKVTEYLNEWDEPLNYTVSGGDVLVGWFSHHDDGREDRRHKFIVCDIY